MKLSAALSLTFLLLSLTAVAPQTINVNCNFSLWNDVYACELAFITIPDNENVNVVIGGVHLPGMNNNLVTRVSVVLSSTPFVITQIFTTFPSINVLLIVSTEITRIQPNAFANAGNLLQLSLTGNQLLRIIPQNAFVGASNLMILDLWGNNIETLHDATFTGLSTLQNIFMDENAIRELPVNVFRPLVSIRTLVLSNNHIESIDGRIFEANPQLSNLQITQNGLNAIGRNFFDGMTSLQNLMLTGNRCVDRNFLVHETTIESVRQELETCFSNFVETPGDEVRRFALELRGSLVLRYENGSEIIRL